MEQEEQQLLARIDERTAAIQATQQGILDFLRTHEERDRQDFKEIHDRISTTKTETSERLGKVEKKQSWMMGIGAAIAFAFTSAIAAIKGIF